MTPIRLCSHPRRKFFRVPARNGRPPWILEKCLDCGANARGVGVAVAPGEVLDPEGLPVLPRAGGSRDGDLDVTWSRMRRRAL